MRENRANESINDRLHLGIEEDYLAGIGQYLSTRQKLQALEELWRRVETAPRDPRLRLRIGDVLQQLGRIDESIEQYREAFFLFLRRGFEKQARAARALILRLRPDDQAILRTLHSDLDLARRQVPLDRETRETNPEGELIAPAPGDDGLRNGHLLALPEFAGPQSMDPLLPRDIVIDSPARTNLIVLPNLKADGGQPDGGTITVMVEDGNFPVVKGRPSDRRIDPRVDVADGAVRLWNGNTAVTGILEDLSSTGLFVSGPRLFQEGMVIDLALKLFPAEWVGTARARVMRSVEGGRRRGAGLGLALVWADAPTEFWIEEIVTRAFGQRRADPTPALPPDAYKDDVRRAYPRGGVYFPAVLRNAEFEVSGWARDLSIGGAFVEAPRVFGPGRRLEALLWLPGSPAPAVVGAVVAHDVRPGNALRAGRGFAPDPTSGEHRGGMGLRFVGVSGGLAKRISAAAAIQPPD